MSVLDNNEYTRTIIDTSQPGILEPEVAEFIVRRRPWPFVVFTLDAIIIIAILLVTYCQPLIFRNNDAAISKLDTEPPGEKIEINSMSELDGATKAEVYRLREKYVYRSMFNTENYEPSKEIFSGLQDGKPWYGTENLICHDPKKPAELRADGDSFFSKLINNPSMLIGLDFPNSFEVADYSTFNLCTNKNMLFLPKSISYSEKYNMITAKFYFDKDVINNRHPYEMSGMNAKDLGYKWGYVYNSKNVKFEDEEYSVNRRLYQFRDWLAVGSSCGIKGGCNNLCPMQNEMMFKFEKGSKDAIIDFKLWKERPSTPLSKPDIYYRIIFERG